MALKFFNAALSVQQSTNLTTLNFLCIAYILGVDPKGIFGVGFPYKQVKAAVKLFVSFIFRNFRGGFATLIPALYPRLIHMKRTANEIRA